MSNSFEKSKNYVLDYLYDKLEMSEYKYTMVKNISNLFDLRNNKYYVSSNSCGTPAFIVLKKEGSTYHSFYVNRRSISYEKQHLKRKEVRIKEINLSVSEELYNGTILDGIWIDEELSSNCRGNDDKKKHFIITDIFEFSGTKYIGMNYLKKMAHFEMHFKNYYNEAESDIKLAIQRPYEINNIGRLFKEHISENARKHNIKGICFFPMYSGSKLIYLFDKDEDEHTRNSLLNNELVDNKLSGHKHNNNDDEDDGDNKYKKIYKFRPTDLTSRENIALKFKLKKTDYLDVYDMYSIFYENKKYIMRVIDMAYIPSYSLSIKMSKLFLNEDELIFDCELDVDKNEWIPIDISELKKVDIINEDERIKITEQLVLEE